VFGKDLWSKIMFKKPKIKRNNNLGEITPKEALDTRAIVFDMSKKEGKQHLEFLLITDEFAYPGDEYGIRFDVTIDDNGRVEGKASSVTPIE
jgi:hypothetical protein